MALGVSSGDTGHTAMTPGYSLGDILGGGVELGETLGISVEMSLGESLGIAGTESPEMTFGESVGMMGVRRGDAVGMALGVSLGWRYRSEETWEMSPGDSLGETVGVGLLLGETLGISVELSLGSALAAAAGGNISKFKIGMVENEHKYASMRASIFQK